jgi:hypothetical protein
MGNQNATDQRKESSFLRDMLDDEEGSNSDVEEMISFQQFLTLAKDLAYKWPSGTIEAWLLYKYKDEMVINCLHSPKANF